MGELIVGYVSVSVIGILLFLNIATLFGLSNVYLNRFLDVCLLLMSPFFPGGFYAAVVAGLLQGIFDVPQDITIFYVCIPLTAISGWFSVKWAIKEVKTRGHWE